MRAKIAVVSGDISERDYLVRVLKRHHYEVEPAATGRKALRLLEVSSFDLALLDLESANPDGLDMVERFNEAGVSSIVLSRPGKLDIALQAVRRGAFDYVERPIRDFDALLVTVQRALEVRDLVRENREAAQRLEQAECMSNLGQMMASVAHEIRNPLVAIGSLARRIVKTAQEEQLRLDATAADSNLAQPCSRYASIIVDQTKRLDRMVQDILDYANLRMPELEEVRLGECFDKVAKLLLPQVEDRSITLIDEIDPATRLYADSHQLEQIFINLVQNALDAMPEGGLIHVQDEVDDSFVRVRFRDTGCGIPTHVDTTRIFDPFVTTKRAGSGLGLAVTHRIMDSHQGKVMVERTGPEGTTFLLTFPRVESFPKGNSRQVKASAGMLHT